jgi:hypothetical protein
MSAVDEFVSLEGWLDGRGHDETRSAGHQGQPLHTTNVEDVFDIMSSIYGMLCSYADKRSAKLTITAPELAWYCRDMPSKKTHNIVGPNRSS